MSKDALFVVVVGYLFPKVIAVQSFWPWYHKKIIIQWHQIEVGRVGVGTRALLKPIPFDSILFLPVILSFGR